MTRSLEGPVAAVVVVDQRIIGRTGRLGRQLDLRCPRLDPPLEPSDVTGRHRPGAGVEQILLGRHLPGTDPLDQQAVPGLARPDRQRVDRCNPLRRYCAGSGAAARA